MQKLIRKSEVGEEEKKLKKKEGRNWGKRLLCPNMQCKATTGVKKGQGQVTGKWRKNESDSHVRNPQLTYFYTSEEAQDKLRFVFNLLSLQR